MDIADYNREAWDGQVARKNPWTVPVSPEVIASARRGDWSIILTPQKPVPRSWFPPLKDLRVLCLAGSGGQQAPVLAAAGARVTVLDNSPAQLGQDRLVAERDDLSIETVQGDMRDLSCFQDGSFDLIVHPCSNCFVPEIRPVWNEAYRVMAEGGVLMVGFTKPVVYLFDEKQEKEGKLVVRHKLPYSDLESLTEEEQQEFRDEGEPLVWSHTLEDQLGGQLDAGFVLTDLFEDVWPERKLSEYIGCFLGTRAVKLPA